MVEAEFILGRLEASLDCPPQPGDALRRQKQRMQADSDDHGDDEMRPDPQKPILQLGNWLVRIDLASRIGDNETRQAEQDEHGHATDFKRGQAGLQAPYGCDIHDRMLVQHAGGQERAEYTELTILVG
jgi:hypothetical protein